MVDIREDTQTSDDDLQTVRQEMRQLIYHFSHDLRNPLVNMRALLNDMRSMMANAEAGSVAILEHEMPETVVLLEQSVDQMSGMINATNNLYHCMFDELECESVNLNELVDRMLSRFKGRLLKVDVSLGRLADVWADPLALARVVEGMLEHALTAMEPAGGKLSLSVEGGGGLETIVVSDSGCGISQDDLEQIFSPFFIRKEGVSGVGLAVVKALVESHGGRVWCESQFGAGTTLYATFPVSTERESTV